MGLLLNINKKQGFIKCCIKNDADIYILQQTIKSKNGIKRLYNKKFKKWY